MADWKNIKYAMCTLFDSNYLDKGLVLYDSLVRNASNFTLYILAMNDKCYEVLVDMQLKNVIPIKLSDFENDDLLRVKPTRGIGEYCWTCGSSLLKYVLETYQPDYCSYIDADMAFYDDPLILIDELEERKASVSIVGHRFNWYERKAKERVVGKYCVECNTFKNDIHAKLLLDLWVSQCLDYCSIDGDGIHWGDQKYMDKWVDDYSYVIETNIVGAGVAPWNVSQYKFCGYDEKSKLMLKCGKRKCNLLFYHFENLCFVKDNVINIGVYDAWGIDDHFIHVLYDNYVKEILNKKQFIKDKYNIYSLIKKHPGIVSTNVRQSFFAVFIRIISSQSEFLTYLCKRLPYRFYGYKNYLQIESYE